jgi:hypothetical protein
MKGEAVMTKAPVRAKHAEPEHAPKKAPKKSAKQAAASHPAGKKYSGGRERPVVHESQADTLRAYRHLARAGLLMAHVPPSKSLEELKRLSQCARAAFEDDAVPPRVAAEAARALEHLLFVALSTARDAAQATPEINSGQNRDLSDQLTQDLAEQASKVQQAEAIFLKKSGSKLSDARIFLILAKHSLLTAQKMLNEQEWQIVHECLKAANALSKAVGHSL